MRSTRTLRRTGAGAAAAALLAGCGGSDGPTAPTGPPSNADSYVYTQARQIQASTDGIASLALSPDGSTLAYGEFGSNAIRIVNAQTGAEIRVLNGHTKPVTELAFSPSGRYVASQGTVNLPPGTDGSIRVWDLQNNGTQVATVATSGVGDLAFSPDGTLLASASGGDPLQVQLWNASSLAPVRTFPNVFRKVAFSPNGLRIATLARDALVRIVDAANGSQLSALSGHSGWATSVAYNSDGTMLVSGGEDRSLRLWDAASGALTRTITGHTSYPEWMRFSPTGKVLASLGSGVNITRTGSSVSVSISSADRRLRLWDVETGTAMPAVDTGGDVIAAAQFSANWNVLVTGSDSGLIRIFTR